MTSGASLVPAISEHYRLYRILVDQFDCTHWEARTLLIHRLGFSRTEIKRTMKRGRRQVGEEHSAWIQSALRNTLEKSPSDQASWILRQAWPDGGAPVIQWAVVKATVVQINMRERGGSHLRWNRVGRLRRYEAKEALKKWESREIGAWLRLNDSKMSLKE